MLELLLPATEVAVFQTAKSLSSDVSLTFLHSGALGTTSDMHTREKKKILAVVDDLLFTVKINDAAKRAGLDVQFLKSERDIVDKATHEKPLLIIIDLNNNSVEPLALIEKLKAHDDLKKISLIGYLSHVQGELKQKAHEAGANIVMARSAFSQNLQQILKRHAGVV